ncbi:FecR family protein [Mucilaginibacter segetis]|uniref:FecR family protein n=1 Tax=Mucilaginibacter segetis TaxID=2793071 RepID=A0A934PRT8_9SPHI|nr:FecR family protein [Mucilaginibacter segetis]MBK0378451.1 FecR family protein [Mucilaginibacter segetis]
MQKIDIKDLLSKYKTGTISEEELSLLEDWYLQWQVSSHKIDDEEFEKLKDEVWQTLMVLPPTSKPRSVWPRVSIAASILILLSVGLFLFSREKKTQEKQDQQVVKNDVAPGSNKAVLTLANGAHILLTDAKNGKLADQNNMQISKTADGRIAYTKSGHSSPNTDNAPAYNTMTTPRGGQYQLSLSDGTKVWLNAASSITYPVVFSGTKRNVEITGEAYFEVAHNKDMPFVVSSGNQKIQVLGTHFNIKAYADDDAMSTTLVQGSVLVENLTSGKTRKLTPGQQANIALKKGDIHISKVNTDEVISWKNGYFIFDNEDITSIMKMLSRWYNVDVVYSHINKNEKFGGTFSRSSNLSEIFANLELVGKVHFNIINKKILVTN